MVFCFRSFFVYPNAHDLQKVLGRVYLSAINNICTVHGIDYQLLQGYTKKKTEIGAPLFLQVLDSGGLHSKIK